MRFAEFSENLTKIECLSIPRESQTNNSDKAEQIYYWWHRIEQRSIEMALEYSSLTHTDMKDCYGSIYTHSIAWALHGKETAKQNRNCNKLIGNNIDKLIQCMSYSQTNGIPQGSVLMDFIAEMVLGYIDLELAKSLKNLIENQSNKIGDFKILRYRDDYRIFSHSIKDNDRILKCISEESGNLGIKLSPEKTHAASNIISGSVKKDRIFWVRQKQTEKNLQKTLYIIHNLSLDHPNSASLVTALDDFYRSLIKELYGKITHCQ